PEEFIIAMSAYVGEIREALEAPSLMRPRYFNKRIPGEAIFPASCNPVYDRDVTVPLLLLPRPTQVAAWSASVRAKDLGWRTIDKAFDKLPSQFGRTIVFQRGRKSVTPVTTPAMPHGSGLSPGIFVDGDLLLRAGKMVTSPRYDRNGMLADEAASLKLGVSGGATLQGEFISTAPFAKNSRLRWVMIREANSVRKFLAYALVDGNGALRPEAPETSNFVRSMTCTQHQVKVGNHSAMLLPTPLIWAANDEEMSRYDTDTSPCEDWCLDDWFPAQKDACWVIREAEDSKPLQESFLLMPASEKSDRPVFFIALFAETEPKQLVKELAALYNVSPDTALNSPETMTRLNWLYEKVRDFPLDK
ncbi:MAG TPA: hypothetical protein VGM98_24625, partial [Schlesneria sp.]